MTEQQVIEILRRGLKHDTDIRVEKNNNAFTLQLVGDEFAGLSTVKRHQKVYQLLADAISSGDIHAVNIRALTAAELPQER